MEAIGAQRVYSFDHVAINDKVTACDMERVPLADEALDVAVFPLSLMGKNWYDYIRGQVK
jgi:ribosomal RNA-processing protein 8